MSSAVIEASSADQPAFGRSLMVIALTVPLMLLGDYGVSYATVLAIIIGGPLLLLVAIIIAFALLVSAIAALSKVLTGKLMILGPVVTVGVLTSAGAVGFLSGILRPLAVHQDVLLHVAVCVMSALALGIFLGPGPLRLAGSVSVVGLIAILALTPTPTESAAVERASAEAERLDDVRASWISSGRFPLVTDLPGWSNVEVRATGIDASTWVRSDTGSVARIIVQWDALPPDPVAPCNHIGGPGLEWDRGFDQLPTWCIRSGNQWSRSDGSAFYTFDAGTTTRINAFGGYDAERVGGSAAASAQEITALLPSLRVMSQEEAERYLLSTFDGIDSPEVQTPDL